MDTYISGNGLPGAMAQGDLFVAQDRGEAPALAGSHWLREQLQASIKRLVRTVNTLVYTRNPVAVAVAAQQCDQLQHILQDFQQKLGRSHAAACGVDELLLVETHQLLAEARRLVSAPLKPVWRSDNVIELQPDYGDLTDAAFERMLASSDIPQLLTSSEAGGANIEYGGANGDEYWDECCDHYPCGDGAPVDTVVSRSRANLKLVYANGNAINDEPPTVGD